MLDLLARSTKNEVSLKGVLPMSLLLRRLRGEPFLQIPSHGQMLTCYRQGMLLGLVLLVVSFALAQLPFESLALPWQIAYGLVLGVGFYLGAALMASRAPSSLPPELAATRWL
ncbi:hypothetical protein [Comamonas aquatilis]|uniref:hypothetical protein n=1 Tax=Comamonas aquatilis TaxID=1778406 RepID=UPI0039EECCD9